MSNEQQLLIDEAYGKYADSHWTPPSNPKGKLLSDQLFSVVPMEHSKESFINKCRTDSEFSEKWGLTIEERELNLEERAKLLSIKIEHEIKETSLHGEGQFETEVTQDANAFNIPTQLITITYQDQTIESYEN
jgi:hypothetical protein